MNRYDVNELVNDVLCEVRTNPVYLADETGECFDELLTLALCSRDLSPRLAEAVEAEINFRLARAGGAV